MEQMKETIMYMLETPQSWRESRYSRKPEEYGWGYGYLLLEEGHGAIEEWYDGEYFHLHGEDFREEFSLCHWETHNGKKYLRVGFDTLHLGQSLETHPFERVLELSLAMQRIAVETEKKYVEIRKQRQREEEESYAAAMRFQAKKKSWWGRTEIKIRKSVIGFFEKISRWLDSY